MVKCSMNCLFLAISNSALVVIFTRKVHQGRTSKEEIVANNFFINDCR